MLATKTIRVTLALSLTTLILTACGGGGGGGETPTPTVPTEGVSITTSSARSVGATVINSSNIVEGASEGAGILTGVSVQPSESDFNYADFIVRLLNQILEQDSLRGSSLTGVEISDTISCTTGNYTRTGTIANQGTLTEGDALSVTFNDCAEITATINGAMTFTITQYDTSSDPITFDFDVVLSNLAVTANSSGQVTTSSGDMSMVLSGDGTMRISGDSLSASSGSQREILTDYDYVITEDDTTGAYSLTMQGTLASDRINGSVSFTTITPLTSNVNQSSGNPTVGEVHITTSADNSQAWLIAQPDGVYVQIDVDTDGDNVADSTAMSTWEELESL